MRVLTQMALPGMVVAQPVVTADGLPLLGRGTRLTRRHLEVLLQERVRFLMIEDDPDADAWLCIPEPEVFVEALEARFSSVEGDPHQAALKRAIAEVYLDYLLSLGEAP